MDSDGRLSEQEFAMKVSAAALSVLLTTWAVMGLLSALTIATFVPTQLFPPLIALLVGVLIAKVGGYTYNKTTHMARYFLDEAVRPNYPEFENWSSVSILVVFLFLSPSSGILYLLIQHYLLLGSIIPNQYPLSVLLSQEYSILIKTNVVLAALQLSATLAITVSSGYGFYRELTMVTKTQIFCGECHNKVESDDKFCRECGADLKESLVIERGIKWYFEYLFKNGPTTEGERGP